MSELMFIYSFFREAGQFAPLVVMIVLFFMWKNELAHCASDIKWVRNQLVEHLKWHSEQ